MNNPPEYKTNSQKERNPYLLKHGLPFSFCLKNQVIDPLKALRGKMSTMLLLDGVQGTGKTSLAIHILDHVEETIVDFTQPARLSMGGEDFVKNAMEAYNKGYKSVIYDEGADFSNMAQTTKFNNTLIQFFNKNRAFKLIVVLCLPYAYYLDPRLYAVANVAGCIHICPNYEHPENPRRRFYIYDIAQLSRMRYLTKMYYRGNPWDVYDRVDVMSQGVFCILPPERDAALVNFSTTQKMESAAKLFEDKPVKVGKPKPEAVPAKSPEGFFIPSVGNSLVKKEYFTGV